MAIFYTDDERTNTENYSYELFAEHLIVGREIFLLLKEQRIGIYSSDDDGYIVRIGDVNSMTFKDVDDILTEGIFEGLTFRDLWTEIELLEVY